MTSNPLNSMYAMEKDMTKILSKCTDMTKQEMKEFIKEDILAIVFFGSVSKKKSFWDNFKFFPTYSDLDICIIHNKPKNFFKDFEGNICDDIYVSDGYCITTKVTGMKRHYLFVNKSSFIEKINSKVDSCYKDIINGEKLYIKDANNRIELFGKIQERKISIKC